MTGRCYSNLLIQYRFISILGHKREEIISQEISIPLILSRVKFKLFSGRRPSTPFVVSATYPFGFLGKRNAI
jgi:hypothetical protein